MRHVLKTIFGVEKTALCKDLDIDRLLFIEEHGDRHGTLRKPRVLSPLQRPAQPVDTPQPSTVALPPPPPPPLAPQASTSRLLSTRDILLVYGPDTTVGRPEVDSRRGDVLSVLEMETGASAVEEEPALVPHERFSDEAAPILRALQRQPSSLEVQRSAAALYAEYHNVEGLWKALRPREGGKAPKLILLRASTLIAWANEGRPLPNRQTIEAEYPDAIMPVERLEALQATFDALKPTEDTVMEGEGGTFFNPIYAVPVVSISCACRAALDPATRARGCVGRPPSRRRRTRPCPPTARALPPTAHALPPHRTRPLLPGASLRFALLASRGRVAPAAS